MKALLSTGSGPLGVGLATVDEPVPAPGEAVVEVHAVAVNRGDLTMATLRPAGSRLGWDVAGVVVQIAADGTGPPVGARVVGLASWDGWAERVAIPVGRLAVVPDDVSMPVAAALPVAGLTALYALQAGGWLLGRTVLVTGASGGVGRVAVQLAAAAGARVLAVVGSATRGTGLAELGAAEVAEYARMPAEPVDVLLDSVGGDVLAAAYANLAPGGAMVSYGNTARSELRLPHDWGHARAGVTLHYVYLFDEITRRPVDRELATLVSLVRQGRLDPRVDLVAPWTDPVPVLRSLQDRQVNGKAVLTLT
jgi:NADPH:quinone reductase-like Zn-dependent oxidoreductase